MANSQNLLYEATTGSILKKVDSFLHSSEPNKKAIDRTVIPKQVNITSYLERLKLDVRSLLETYNLLKENNKIPDDSVPIALGMLSNYLNVLNSYLIAYKWYAQFPPKEWSPRYINGILVIIKSDLSKILTDWITTHRARIGLIESPIDIVQKKMYFLPYPGLNISVLDAEAIIRGLLKKYTNDADLINHYGKESTAIRLIMELSGKRTAPQRTSQGLMLTLENSIYRALYKRKIEKEQRKQAQGLDLSKVKTSEEAIQLMGELREELYKIQESITKREGDIEKLKELESQVIKQMKNVRQR